MNFIKLVALISGLFFLSKLGIIKINLVKNILRDDEN